MHQIREILGSLADVVDLGFAEVPMFIAISAVLVLLGLGLRKSWLSMGGVVISFAFYFLAKMSASI